MSEGAMSDIFVEVGGQYCTCGEFIPMHEEQRITEPIHCPKCGKRYHLKAKFVEPVVFEDEEEKK